MRLTFTVYISGSGATVDDCWNDATEAFSADPGDTPMTYTEDDEEEDEA